MCLPSLLYHFPSLCGEEFDKDTIFRAEYSKVSPSSHITPWKSLCKLSPTRGKSFSAGGAVVLFSIGK